MENYLNDSFQASSGFYYHLDTRAKGQQRGRGAGVGGEFEFPRLPQSTGHVAPHQPRSVRPPPRQPLKPSTSYWLLLLTWHWFARAVTSATSFCFLSRAWPAAMHLHCTIHCTRPSIRRFFTNIATDACRTAACPRDMAFTLCYCPRCYAQVVKW